MFTIGNWLLVVFWIIATVFCTIVIAGVDDFDTEGWLHGLINFIVSGIMLAGICFGIRWYNTNTASGIRAVKDFKSELSNGIDREITITAEDGREIFHYEGKVDVESNHTDNYIKFESEEGKRYIIYYGIQDTIKIIER